MKKTLTILALAGILTLGGCSKDVKFDAMHVGQRFDYSLNHKMVEETTDYKKYLVYSNETGIESAYVTVKKDTIVSIWKRH